MALVDGPRLLVWYESSVCLWCVCGLLKSFSLFFLLQWYEGEKCTQSVIEHSLMNPWWITVVCVCVCVWERERESPVVAALYLMHDSDTIQPHFTWTISTSKTAACFALYYLSFAPFHFTCSLPSGFLFDVIHVMQNWLRRLASMPAAMKLSQCEDRFPGIDSLNLTL